MAVTGQGATFSFTSNLGNFAGKITKITVEAETAEIADVTGLYDVGDAVVLVPTGAWKGGSINIEYQATTTEPSISTLIRGYGQLVFDSPGYSARRQAILESGSESVSVGDVARGSLRFVVTDWYG